MAEKLIFEISDEGKIGVSLPEIDVPERDIKELIPEKYMRKRDPILPEVSEPEVVRHFINLSTMNHHIDKGFYPLGSCTMKYNPKINEEIARFTGFTSIHPLQTQSTCQGVMQIMWELERYLCEITGMDAFTLQPAAGSQGELTGIMVMKKYHSSRGSVRKKVLIPDSAHGTNPASVTIGGYRAQQINSNPHGLIDIADLERNMSSEVAGLMLTNPNTLGLFEREVEKIAELVHKYDALLYLDGANLNALLGITRPKEMGFDITHLNLHKTFSAPHGGGGPGSGPVGVVSRLERFLPIPRITKEQESFILNYNYPDSIGRFHSFYGNFNVLLKAYVYIRMLGSAGLSKVSENAIINANYLKLNLERVYRLPFKGRCMHEFVISGEDQKVKGARTLDIAKRLLDYGFHAPTIYFPLIVKEALMIEPTETESRETLDNFISCMIKIDEEISKDSSLVTGAPYKTPIRRLDEVKAARELNLRWSSDNA
ncbi:MAG: aminomethyl-transferring glycine dehydrogenase subunit GcvPB [Fidelibacterota bacterium]